MLPAQEPGDLLVLELARSDPVEQDEPLIPGLVVRNVKRLMVARTAARTFPNTSFGLNGISIPQAELPSS